VRHRKQSVHYLHNAQQFIEKDDAEKAGEFLWGGMSRAIKALASANGVVLRGHRELRNYARGLARETRNENIWKAFWQARALHGNFYETGLLMEDVVESAATIMMVVSWLLTFIPEESA
jgi:hypothetical protein